MPILSQIELFLDRSYSSEEQKEFIFKSRCICNFLERELEAENYETTLSRINIHCSRDEKKVRVHPLKTVPFLEVCILYEVPTLRSLDEPLLQEHYKRIIDFGLKAAVTYMPIPHSYCMRALRKFESGGFKNEWIQSEKNFEKVSLRSIIIAQLTTERFILWQYIYQKDVVIAKCQIAETKTREMLFIDYLGDLSLDKNGDIVYKRKGKLLSKFNVESQQFSAVNCK